MNGIVNENPGKGIVRENKIISLSGNINLHLQLTSKTDCFPSISICCIPRGINSRLSQLVETVPLLGKNKEKKTKRKRKKKRKKKKKKRREKREKDAKPSMLIIIDYS